VAVGKKQYDEVFNKKLPNATPDLRVPDVSAKGSVKKPKQGYGNGYGGGYNNNVSYGDRGGDKLKMVIKN